MVARWDPSKLSTYSRLSSRCALALVHDVIVLCIVALGSSMYVCVCIFQTCVYACMYVLCTFIFIFDYIIQYDE